MPPTIRVDEWLEAVRELEERQVEGFSAAELSEATGLSTKTTLLRVNALIAAGKMRLAGYRRGVAAHGRTKYTPVYQMVQEGA